MSVKPGLPESGLHGWLLQAERAFHCSPAPGTDHRSRGRRRLATATGTQPATQVGPRRAHWNRPWTGSSRAGQPERLFPCISLKGGGEVCCRCVARARPAAEAGIGEGRVSAARPDVSSRHRCTDPMRSRTLDSRHQALVLPEPRPAHRRGARASEARLRYAIPWWSVQRSWVAGGRQCVPART